MLLLLGAVVVVALHAVTAGGHALVCCDRCLGDHGALQEVSALALRSGVEPGASVPCGTSAVSALTSACNIYYTCSLTSLLRLFLAEACMTCRAYLGSLV